MRLLAVLSLLALLGRALSTKSAPVPAGPRADPRDFREYLSPEGMDDPSAEFVANCLAQMFSGGLPVIWNPVIQRIVAECVKSGQTAGLAMKTPYMSDWARWLEFDQFAICLTWYILYKPPFLRRPVQASSPDRHKREYAQKVEKGTGYCQSTLPATIVHRPTVPVHEGAPAAEHGASEPLLFRHGATRRAGRHPMAWIRRLGPVLLREMRPVVQRAGAVLETRPRVMEY
ncbi:MAG: hypothetical protein M1826_003148 [Phylliscum demangeonii]|nr:MAG: hypothetical protein M1826_003148 [Phylliscum demangeonii]